MIRLAVFALFCALLLGTARGVEKISPDPRAEALCNRFLQALQLPDEQDRLQAVLPLVHRSLLNRAGTDLYWSVRGFSYRKAVRGAPLYATPARIVEVQRGSTLTIGFEETAERGRVDRYFVAKRPGVAGRPAPLHVFWPEDGGEPSLVNFGSL